MHMMVLAQLFLTGCGGFDTHNKWMGMERVRLHINTDISRS